jgi:hypothetical protein
MAMNRPVRSRTQGGVGRAGEKLALTRFKCGFDDCVYKTGIHNQHH